MKRLGLAVVSASLIAGVALAAELNVGPPTAAPVRPETPPKVTVSMTAATLGDDCGDAVPNTPPQKRSQSEVEGRRDESRGASARGRRRCEPTSMQLSVVSPAGLAATELRVKSVDLFDENGVRVSGLTPRPATRWSGTAYVPWDGKIAGGDALAVSYPLSRPDWSTVDDRWNHTFTMKATLTVGGVDETVEHDVTVSAQTSLPPNVRT